MEMTIDEFDEILESMKEPKKVWLTVEEAKDVLECVDACAFPSPFVGFVSKTILLRDKLKKRIEQAEKGHEAE